MSSGDRGVEVTVRQRQTSDSRLGDDAHGYGLPECLRHVVKFTSGGTHLSPGPFGRGDRFEHPS
jgi:hypothetical protein